MIAKPLESSNCKVFKSTRTGIYHCRGLRKSEMSFPFFFIKSTHPWMLTMMIFSMMSVNNTFVNIGSSLVVLALDNGLALTPPMALSTWSVFKGNINHSLIVELTDSMVQLGLPTVGYEYLLMDAGWSTDLKNCTACLPRRDQHGRLVVDKVKFPNLTDTIEYVHSKNIKFGLWFGVEMCATTNDDDGVHSGYDAIDFATLDAEFFASLGVDAIKHDSCGIYVTNTSEGLATNFAKYESMSLALNKTGRPILYDVTLQVDKPNRTLPAYDYNYIWSPEPYGQENVQRIANMWWSVPLNKYNCWSCCVHPNEYIVPDDYCNTYNHLAAWRGLLPMIDIQDMGTPGWAGHWDWAGRGKGWNHLDQLGICVGKSWYGPGLTRVEQITQVSLWAVLASPMIIGVDIRNTKNDTFCYNLITNPHVIAVHQDLLGIPGLRLKNNYYQGDNDKRQLRLHESYDTHKEEKDIETQIWGRPLQNGSVAVIFLNRAETERTIQATFDEIGLQTVSSLSQTQEQKQVTTVRTTNVWTGVSKSGISSPLVATSVPPHGVIFLIVTPEDYTFYEKSSVYNATIY